MKRRARLRICKRSFLYKGITIWNELDDDIVKRANQFTFKKVLKIYLVSNPGFIGQLDRTENMA